MKYKLRDSGKLILGVGKNDLTESVSKDSVLLDCWNCWRSMLSRCYGPRNKYNGSYINCTVCDEWHLLSNFKNWYIANYRRGYHMDKDILKGDSAVYSPDTCCMVPAYINLMLNRKDTIAVVPYHCKSRPWQIKSSQYSKGIWSSHATYEEAKECYLNGRREYIRNVAFEALGSGEIDCRIMNALLKIYK